VPKFRSGERAAIVPSAGDLSETAVFLGLHHYLHSAGRVPLSQRATIFLITTGGPHAYLYMFAQLD